MCAKEMTLSPQLLGLTILLLLLWVCPPAPLWALKKKSHDFSCFSSAHFELCAVTVYKVNITPPLLGEWLFFFFLTVVKYALSKSSHLNYFKYTSVAFGTLAVLCDHHHYLVPKHFYHCKRNPHNTELCTADRVGCPWSKRTRHGFLDIIREAFLV